MRSATNPYNGARYRMLAQSNPEQAEILLKQAQEAIYDRWQRYEDFAKQRTAEAAKAEVLNCAVWTRQSASIRRIGLTWRYAGSTK